MYIKEIKIHGFKSFADKLTIELDPTFTGIVGPNGSGKSTILKIVGKIENVDSGEVSIKRGIKIGYLSRGCRKRQQRPCGSERENGGAKWQKGKFLVSQVTCVVPNRISLQHKLPNILNISLWMP